MMLLEEMNRIESGKDVWSPIPPITKADNQIHPVVNKCLQLRELEIDVQGWTLEFNSTLDSDLFREIQLVLDGHAMDEDNHAIVLDYLADYWGCVSVSSEAKEIIEDWVNFDVNPMVKKTFLEAGIFFSIIPLLNRYSNFDKYTSTVGDWIMIDEVRHVRSARLLMKHFNLKGKKSILALIEKTLRWILSSEPIEVQDKWVKRSIAIALSGKCDDFTEDSMRTVSGHFDQTTNKQVKNGYTY